MTWATLSSEALSAVAADLRPEIHASSTPHLRSSTRPRPSVIEKRLDSVPSEAMQTVPSVRTPSTSMAKRRTRAHCRAVILGLFTTSIP